MMEKHYPDEYIDEDGKTYIDRDGMKLRVLKNGALMNTANGNFMPGAVITTSIQGTEMAREYSKRRAEKRRAIVMEAANEAVENGTWLAKYGDYAFVAALANNAMMKATTPEDPKAIEAARFVLAQAGMLDEGESEKDENTSVLTALGREAVQQILARAKEIRERQSD